MPATHPPSTVPSAPDPVGPSQVIPGLVTIVVPVFRADRFIPGMLDCIRRQRYEAWELIVVEDASNGATRDLVKTFGREMPDRRILYMRQEQNQGPNAARNKAIAEARGEYLALLDADDRWLETHLVASIEALQNEGADIAYSTVVKFQDETNALLGLWGPSQRDLEQFPSSLVGRNFITPSASVLRRKVIDVVGPLDETIRVCEDLEYWFRAVQAGQKFVHVPGCHCLYRKGAAGSGSGSLRRTMEYQALVLARHFGTGNIPVKVWRRNLVFYRTAAGVLNLEEDARRAAHYFFEAWRAQPARIDLLALSLVSRTVMPWLPDLGIIRRINRAIAPR